MFVDETNKMPTQSLDNAARSAGYVIEKSLQLLTTKSHISLAEFIEFINIAQENVLTKEEVEKSFRQFDLDDSGYIKATDFKKILSSRPDALSESEISIIFEMFPPNDAGMICYSLPINYIFNECKE